MVPNTSNNVHHLIQSCRSGYIDKYNYFLDSPCWCSTLRSTHFSVPRLPDFRIPDVYVPRFPDTPRVTYIWTDLWCTTAIKECVANKDRTHAFDHHETCWNTDDRAPDTCNVQTSFKIKPECVRLWGVSRFGHPALEASFAFVGSLSEPSRG